MAHAPHAGVSRTKDLGGKSWVPGGMGGAIEGCSEAMGGLLEAASCPFTKDYCRELQLCLPGQPPLSGPPRGGSKRGLR